MKIQAFKLIVVALLFSVQVWAQSVESIMNSGQEMLQRGAYSQAVSAFRQVVSRESGNFEAQFNLAFAYLGWGRHSNAVEEFKKAMRLQPRSSEVWANLAVAYENLGQSEDAMGALYQAVQLDPQNTTARMNLAAMYANANHHSKAVAQYKHVIENDGMDEDALTNLSKCLIALGKTDEAKNYLKQAVASNPNNGDAHWELGNIYWKKDSDIDRAITEYKLAISVQPSGTPFYESLALAFETKGDKIGAIDILKKSLIYTDDALRKEKIQGQIERLETGEPKNVKKTEESGSKIATKEQINDLRKELGKGEGKSSTTSARRINTAPVDIMGDFSDINAEDDKESDALDLTDQAKKRAEKE